MRNFIDFFVSRSLFVNLLTIIILIVGAFYVANINREAFPNIDFDIVTVTTIFQGASASEVEKLVSIPIEDELKAVGGLDKITSSSIEGRSGIVIWIDPDQDDTRQVIDDIKTAIDRVSDLPEDAEEPLVLEVTSSRQPIIEIAFAIPEKNGKMAIAEKQLRDFAYRFEKKALDLPGVAQVVRRGYRDREMIVELDPYAMERFYVSSQQVVGALAERNVNVPGGKITTSNGEYILRTLGEFSNAEQIRKVFVRSNDLGDFINIEDIAEVIDDFEEKLYIEKTNGMQSISLTIVKKESADILDTVDSVMNLVADFKDIAPSNLEISKVNDLSFFVSRRLNVLINNSIVGVGLVIVSLFFFLSWRIGLMVALGMITAMAGSFAFIGHYGGTLNLISMFGLVIVIGMVVDDAIIVAENIHRRFEEGLSPYEATIQGASEVIIPVTATIITSVAAFSPMMFMSGIFGKFIFYIPFVVVVTLIASLIESFLILPNHVHDLIKKETRHAHDRDKSTILFGFIQQKLYVPVFRWALAHRGLTVLIINLLFISSIIVLVIFGKFKLFSGAIDTFQIKFEAPRGYSLEQTDQYARIIEQQVALLDKSELENYSTRIGIVSQGPNDPNTKRGSNYGQVTVYMTPEVTRQRSSEEIIEQIRQATFWLASDFSKNDSTQQNSLSQHDNLEKNKQKYDHLAGTLIKLEYEKLQGGPPVGKAVSIEIKGEDFDTLKQISAVLEKGLAEIPGAVDIGNDFGEGKNEIQIFVDERKANYAGVSVLSVAGAVRTAFAGTVATSIRTTQEEIDVRVRFQEKYQKSIESLKKVMVNNRQGQLIPITELVTFKEEMGITYINHLDSDRVIRTQCNVNEEISTSAEVNRIMQNKFIDLEKQFPGYSIRYGGENEDTQESLASLGRAFLVAALFIFLILASLFRSLLQPAIVMMAIPFAFIGVIFAFVSHGQFFGFLAIMGVVGLSGIVVNDSIVLVDFANKIHRENPSKPILEVAFEAGNMRLRAVVLTTLTTVLGLLPTAYGIGGYDPFLVPAALAFAWGLVVSSFITLIIVPILYTWTFDLHNFGLKIIRSQRDSTTV